MTSHNILPVEAERHLVASAFHDPDWLASARRDIEPAHFADPRCQEMWAAVVATTEDAPIADELSVVAHLRLKGRLDLAGGAATVSETASLLMGPTSATARWQRLVTDAHRSRVLSAALATVRAKAESGAYTPEEIAAELTTLAESAKPRAKGDSGPARFDFDALMAFDRSEDPTCVLGNRWLCRGGSCLLVAQTGAGKSALTTQAAMTWALGRDFFGIQSRKGPLRSLVVQSENDLGDVAESVQGTLQGLGIAASSDLARDIGSRVHFYREAVRTGDEFGRLLRELVLATRADLVFVDPLLGFAGIDIADQQQASHFLRHVLQPVLTETGVILFSIHHTTKPKPKAEQPGATSNDLSYLGAGSAELANWHRAVMILQRDPTPEGQDEQPHFSLRLAKRGGRAGLKDALGDFTTAIPIRHAKERGVIRWERRSIDPSGEPATAF